MRSSLLEAAFCLKASVVCLELWESSDVLRKLRRLRVIISMAPELKSCYDTLLPAPRRLGRVLDSSGWSRNYLESWLVIVICSREYTSFLMSSLINSNSLHLISSSSFTLDSTEKSLASFNDWGSITILYHSTYLSSKRCCLILFSSTEISVLSNQSLQTFFMFLTLVSTLFWTVVKSFLIFS